MNQNTADDDGILMEDWFITTVKVTSSITALLSILGASLIIFTYVAFKNLRTTARQLLVAISIADIIVAASHFIGLMANFDRFARGNSSLESRINESTRDFLCVSQAAFSMFGTLASFFLTLAIGAYLVGILTCKNPSTWKKIIPAIYIVCWGTPVILIIPILVLRYFGFVLGADVG